MNRFLERFTQRYYEDKNPAVVLDALRALARDAHALRSTRDPDGWIYLFVRAAEVQPELLQGYRSIAAEEGLPSVGRDFVSLLVKGAEQKPFGSPLEKPVDGPVALDRLWAEFTLTGTAAPIEAVIDVLNNEDEVRKALEQWLAEGAPGGQEAVETLERATSIRVDLATNQILTEGSLDLLVLLDGVQSRGPALRSVLEALPVRLERTALERAAWKSSALWSLAAQATQHQTVRRVCEHSFAKRDGVVRGLLGMVLAATATTH